MAIEQLTHYIPRGPMWDISCDMIAMIRMGKGKGVYLLKVGNTRKNQIDRVPWVLQGLFFCPDRWNQDFRPIGIHIVVWNIRTDLGSRCVDVNEYTNMLYEQY